MIHTQNQKILRWSDWLLVLRSKWPLVVLMGSLGMAAGTYLGWKAPLDYIATARIAVEAPTTKRPEWRTETEVRPVSANAVRRHEAALGSGKNLLEVVEELGLREAWSLFDRPAALTEVRNRVGIRSIGTTGVIEISARSGTREESSDLANTIAETHIARETSQAREAADATIRALDAELRLREDQRAGIESRLRDLAVEGDGKEEAADLRRELAAETHVIRSLEAKRQLAMVDQQKAAPDVMLIRLSIPDEAVALDRRPWKLAGCGLLGCLLGVGGIFVATMRKSPAAIALSLLEDLRLDVAAYAPVPVPNAWEEDFGDEALECYRDLRTRLQRLPGRESLVIMAMPIGDVPEAAGMLGNLASVFADAGNSVLLIDADFRDSRLHERLEAARHPGLSDYLSGEMRLGETVIRTRKRNLWLMPSGPLPLDPSGLLNGKRSDDLFWEMRSRFDYVFVRVPSIHRYSDAGTVAQFADHVLVAASFRHHRIARLRDAKRAVESCQRTLAGVILCEPVGHTPDASPRETKKISNPRPATPRPDSVPATAPNRAVTPAPSSTDGAPAAGSGIQPKPLVRRQAKENEAAEGFGHLN